VIKRANTNLGDVMERINFQKTGTGAISFCWR